MGIGDVVHQVHKDLGAAHSQPPDDHCEHVGDHHLPDHHAKTDLADGPCGFTASPRVELIIKFLRMKLGDCVIVVSVS